MTLWFVLALMTAAALFAVLWPLGRAQRGAPRQNDVAVYRDQLDEVARDRAAGLIGETEAEAARVEVSRRLLAAADAAQAQTDAPPAGATVRRRVAAAGVLVALPALAASLYLAFGSPQLPGQPVTSRATTPVQNRSLDNLVAQVEAHLEKNPDDARGWEVVAPVYMRLGRFDDATRAWRQTLRINGPSADREANLGEALMGVANGIVTSDAKAAFDRALSHDGKHPKARFFLGVAAYQDGRLPAAAEIWRGMLADARPDSPWGPTVRQALAQIEGAASAPQAAAPPGPSADDVAAAEQLSPQDRAAMVQGMVERLADRLKRDGSDVEGWLRLVRAYTVMGDRDRALLAIADARRALGHDADKLRRLDELVRELKLES